MQYFIKVMHVYSFIKLFPMLVKKKKREEKNKHKYAAANFLYHLLTFYKEK